MDCMDEKDRKMAERERVVAGQSAAPQSPTPLTENINDYLACSDVVDWHTPEVMSLARSLAAGVDSEVEKAKRLYQWVRDEISHSADARHETVTCRASEVLCHRTGICYAKAHLLAAMLRAVGIPSGLCYQLLRYDATSDRLIVHGLNGLYLSGIGRWIRVDPRGNKLGVDAQFCVERERLAFEPNRVCGEYSCETIFAEPLPGTLACLRRCANVSELLANLPGRIDADAR